MWKPKSNGRSASILFFILLLLKQEFTSWTTNEALICSEILLSFFYKINRKLVMQETEVTEVPDRSAEDTGHFLLSTNSRTISTTFLTLLPGILPIF